MRLSLLGRTRPQFYFNSNTVTRLLTLGVCIAVAVAAWFGWNTIVRAADASCLGTPITVPGVEKKLISLTRGSRPGNCIKPDLIFVHATDGGDLDSNWEYFNSGSEGNGTNAQFIVGKDGKIYQTVELYPDKTEYAVTNSPYNSRSIGIEMAGPLEFADKSAVPTAQYTATLQLVLFLMNQYKIPIGEHEADWLRCESNDPVTTGVYGHYQLCTSGHTDPGQTMFAAFRQDLKAGGAGTGTSPMPGVAGGRWVPYDAYARPYSWPTTGHILQNYGFTPAAQNLGLRYPALYPKGDPGVIFSTTNHVEPPPNPAVDKFINPNIDISPNGNDPLARAVYSTQAGWITYADWAGEGKGYTIQVESDVDGDGQADLATRYMRLQEPEGGYFAPDIALFHPSSAPTDTTNGQCTDPANADWANVNKWDSQVQQGITEIQTVAKVSVPCNLVKAFMKLESGGVEIAPNSDGYMGLMQVGDRSATGGGSNCDVNKYDVHTTQGNINCGVQEIANGYNECDQSWDGSILAYFTGDCTGNGNACDSFGTCANDYLATVKKNWDYLNSQQGQAAPPSVPPPSSQTLPPPAATQTTPTLPTPFILEAEAMNHGTAADLIHDDQASGGLALRLRENGDLTAAVNQLSDQIVVRAKGDQCGGAPTMVLKMDGQEFARFDVDSSTWTDYTTSAPLDGANHQYTISFINDFTVLSGVVCDRNLFVDSSTLMVTNPNVATTRTVSEQLIEAESLSKRTTTSDSLPEVKSQTSASGGKYVHMVDNSAIADTVTIAKGNWIKVRARGTECQGWPHMVVKLDDTVVLEVDVMDTNWIEYSTLLNVPAGSSAQHNLNISFSNDKYLGPLCDRNLDVDVVKIQDNTVSQTPVNANSLIGKTKYVGFNQLLGYVSTARDHERAGTNYSQVPNANQTYLSYRIMYNNPNFTTFPQPDQPDAFINARVDNPYIVETPDNTVAGSLKVAFDHLQDPMWFFCALRTTGNSVKCIDAPNPY